VVRIKTEKQEYGHLKDKKLNVKPGNRSGKVLFILSIVSFLISSATILFMSYGSFEQDGNVNLAYALAITFWTFLLLGIVLSLIISKQRRRDILSAITDSGGIVFLRFFKNKPATVFDVLLIAGIIYLVVSLLIIRTLPSLLTLASTFTTVFSLEMHVLLNGKNYEWLYKKHDSK